MEKTDWKLMLTFLMKGQLENKVSAKLSVNIKMRRATDF
jgi:hypothetical protein